MKYILGSGVHLNTTIEYFYPAIQLLPKDRPLTKDDLLTGDFLMQKEGSLKIYYAPHNEYINPEAKVIIVGITPGWKQMKTAYEQLLRSNSSGDNLDTALKEAKRAAGFAGSMRRNLVHMLDQCNLPQILDIPCSLDLFGKSNDLLHTTSIIKYPVFSKGKNYTGHQPKISASSLLQHYAFEMFPEELAQIASPALIIPLGKTVEQIILRLADANRLSNHTYLLGFPHPSGANGHRIKQFQEQRLQLREKIISWKGR